MDIVILNKKRGECDIAFRIHYVGRPTTLGNPFTHLNIANTTKVKDVETAVAKYEQWIRCEIDKANPKIINALETIYESAVTNKRIGLQCWCMDECRPHYADHACHAEVIRKILQEQYVLDTQGE